MSSFLDEAVIAMPPLATATIERLGDAVLGVLCPVALERPTALDVLHLVDFELPRHGIHVSPAAPEEIGAREGATDPDGSGEVEVLIEESVWDDLQAGGRQANRARATVIHELSHAILHVPVIRRRRKGPGSEHLLARVERRELPPYRDPEWQAWTLAGCILAPRRTVVTMLPGRDVAALAEVYGVSEGMMTSHLKRLRLDAGRSSAGAQ